MMAKIRGRASRTPGPVGVTVEDTPVSVGSVLHGPDRPVIALAPIDRLRRQLNLSNNCPADQVMSDAVAALESLRQGKT